MTIHIPDVAAQEAAKYTEVWGIPEYHRYSPGLLNVERFVKVMRPHSGARIIDLGCGAANAGLDLADRGYDVTYLDITDAALPPIIDRKHFIQSPLWGKWGVGCRHGNGHRWDYGFCCDVLEHIPVEYTMLCIDRILEYCSVAWLQICNKGDDFGKMIGEPLHVTVQPYSWWLVRIATLGKVVEARDLCDDSLFVVTR